MSASESTSAASPVVASRARAARASSTRWITSHTGGSGWSSSLRRSSRRLSSRCASASMGSRSTARAAPLRLCASRNRPSTSLLTVTGSVLPSSMRTSLLMVLMRSSASPATSSSAGPSDRPCGRCGRSALLGDLVVHHERARSRGAARGRARRRGRTSPLGPRHDSRVPAREGSDVRRDDPGDVGHGVADEAGAKPAGRDEHRLAVPVPRSATARAAGTPEVESDRASRRTFADRPTQNPGAPGQGGDLGQRRDPGDVIQGVRVARASTVSTSTPTISVPGPRPRRPRERDGARLEGTADSIGVDGGADRSIRAPVAFGRRHLVAVGQLANGPASALRLCAVPWDSTVPGNEVDVALVDVADRLRAYLIDPHLLLLRSRGDLLAASAACSDRNSAESSPSPARLAEREPSLPPRPACPLSLAITAALAACWMSARIVLTSTVALLGLLGEEPHLGGHDGKALPCSPTLSPRCSGSREQVGLVRQVRRSAGGDLANLSDLLRERDDVGGDRLDSSLWIQVIAVADGADRLGSFSEICSDVRPWSAIVHGLRQHGWRSCGCARPWPRSVRWRPIARPRRLSVATPRPECRWPRR